MFITKLPKNIAFALIKVYQYAISPLLPDACRFYPSCSNYAKDAIEKRGVLFGAFLSVKRLLRCNPFCSGGYDPVPEKVLKKELKTNG